MDFTHRSVLFVCTGNICRSPLAHAVFKQVVRNQGLSSYFSADSAGTHGYHVGEDADPRMRETAARNGFSFSHAARIVRPGDLETFDAVFAMDRGHFQYLRSLARSAEQERKIHMYREFDPEGSRNDEVPDPYYGGRRGFDEVFNIVRRTTDGIIEAYKNGVLP